MNKCFACGAERNTQSIGDGQYQCTDLQSCIEREQKMNDGRLTDKVLSALRELMIAGTDSKPVDPNMVAKSIALLVQLETGNDHIADDVSDACFELANALVKAPGRYL